MTNRNEQTPRQIKNIVVEGVECAGKTTLIDEIRRKIRGWDLKFLGHKDGNQFDRYMWEYMVNSGTIFNRAHFSEIVYSQLRNRGEPFSEIERQALDEILGRDSLIIFCDPNIEDVLDRYKQRTVVQPVELEELEVVHGLFRAVFEETPTIKYVSNDMAARDAFVVYLQNLLLKE